MTKTVALPSSPPVGVPPASIRLRFHGYALRHGAGLDVAPECDEELARHGDDRDPAGTPSQGTDAIPEPPGKRALWLVAQPEPGELDEGRPRAWVPCAADAPVPIHRPALMRHRRHSDIDRELTASAESAIEDLARQHGCEVVAEIGRAHA